MDRNAKSSTAKSPLPPFFKGGYRGKGQVKKLLRQSKKYLFISGLIFVIFGAACAFYLVFTPHGIGFLAKLYLSHFLHPQSIAIGKIESSFPERILFKDIELKGIRRLSAENTLRIQECRLSFMKFSLQLQVNNAVLRLPGGEPILFYGIYKDKALDFQVYSKYIELQNIPNHTLKGGLADIDISVSGHLKEPTLKATLNIKDLDYRSFSLSNCPVACEGQIKKAGKKIELYGEARISMGTVAARDLLVSIQNSAIAFRGTAEKAKLDGHGTSNIEGVPITLDLRGTINAPDLRLSSSPPMPEDVLMVMLLTGKAWKSSESLLTQGQLSPILAAEFIDYIALGGSGSRLAKMLGISAVNLRYDGQQKGITIKKAVSDKFEASYAVEQPQTKEGASAATHKVGGEYKVTDSISIGAEKELKQESTTEKNDGQSATEDKVTIKYKKEF